MLQVELRDPLVVQLRMAPHFRRRVRGLIAVHRHVAPGDEVRHEFVRAPRVDARPMGDRADLDGDQPRTLPGPHVASLSEAPGRPAQHVDDGDAVLPAQIGVHAPG